MIHWKRLAKLIEAHRNNLNYRFSRRRGRDVVHIIFDEQIDDESDSAYASRLRLGGTASVEFEIAPNEKASLKRMLNMAAQLPPRQRSKAHGYLWYVLSGFRFKTVPKSTVGDKVQKLLKGTDGTLSVHVAEG